MALTLAHEGKGLVIVRLGKR